MADKEKKRPDTPLAETPDPKFTDVKEVLKDIEKRSIERKERNEANRKALSEKRKSRMESSGTSKGSSIQALETSFGKKIIS
jgi:hypothetical protein